MKTPRNTIIAAACAGALTVAAVPAIGAAAGGAPSDAATQQQAPIPQFVQESQPDQDRDGRDCPKERGGQQQAPGSSGSSSAF